MKAIVLAGLGSKELPKNPNFQTSLTWIINSLQNSGLKDINVVAGKETEDLVSISKEVNVIYNDNWAKTGPLESLLLCEDEIIGSDILVSFGDVVYNTDFINNFISKIDRNKINILTDKRWLKRFNRSQDSINKAEKVEVNKEGFVIKADRNFNDINKISGEYTGICFLSKDHNEELISTIRSIVNCKTKNRKYPFGFMDLFSEMINKKYELKNYYTEDNWAELDNLNDFYNFTFGNKSKTLFNLKGQLKHAKILTQVSFDISTWNKDKDAIIDRVQDHFRNDKLIVRSSSISEDSFESSMAGKFKSLIGIDRDNRLLVREAVEEVIDSYGKSKNNNDLVFIQPLLPNVTISGVVFTCDMKTGAPYYCVNYTKSNETDIVTSGGKGKHYLYYQHKSIKSTNKNQYMSKLINAVKEIEKLVDNSMIDIEFAFDLDEKLYIFQVRPIASEIAVQSYGKHENLETIKDKIKDLENVFSPKPNISGQTTILGKMPDWNPAELIGTRPSPLSKSLFHRLITKKAWRVARGDIGYYNPKNEELLLMIFGQPFIDVRNSINSFTPKDLPHHIREMLVNESIEFLNKNPHLHDKLEFDVATTCYSPYFSNKINRWKEFGFKDKEIEQMSYFFRKHTEKMINGFLVKHDNLLTLVEKLDIYRKEIINRNDIDKISKVEKLITSCEKLGTIPFSTLARFAFVGNTFLKSFVNEEIIPKSSYDSYLNSINTVATELLDELENLKKGITSMDKFLARFGHLRPGTFDITSLRYDQAPDLYFDLEDSRFDSKNSSIISSFKLNSEEKSKIGKLLKELKLEIELDTFLDFIEKSIKGREYSKFIFTRSISDSFNLLAEWGRENGLSKKDISFIDYNFLTKMNSKSEKESDLQLLNNLVKIGKEDFEFNNHLLLPDLICNPRDLVHFHLPTNKPNFVTNNSVSGEVVKIDNNQESFSISDKIVMIESADPGYDWIFTHNIKGLITKYGGVASHMAIRCAEFNLPAAIGCGRQFDTFSTNDKLIIDCSNNLIKRV